MEIYTSVYIPSTYIPVVYDMFEDLKKPFNGGISKPMGAACGTAKVKSYGSQSRRVEKF